LPPPRKFLSSFFTTRSLGAFTSIEKHHAHQNVNELSSMIPAVETPLNGRTRRISIAVKKQILPACSK